MLLNAKFQLINNIEIQIIEKQGKFRYIDKTNKLSLNNKLRF